MAFCGSPHGEQRGKGHEAATRRRAAAGRLAERSLEHLAACGQGRAIGAGAGAACMYGGARSATGKKDVSWPRRKQVSTLPRREFSDPPGKSPYRAAAQSSLAHLPSLMTGLRRVLSWRFDAAYDHFQPSRQFPQPPVSSRERAAFRRSVEHIRRQLRNLLLERVQDLRYTTSSPCRPDAGGFGSSYNLPLRVPGRAPSVRRHLFPHRVCALVHAVVRPVGGRRSMIAPAFGRGTLLHQFSMCA